MHVCICLYISILVVVPCTTWYLPKTGWIHGGIQRVCIGLRNFPLRSKIFKVLKHVNNDCTWDTAVPEENTVPSWTFMATYQKCCRKDCLNMNIGSKPFKTLQVAQGLGTVTDKWLELDPKRKAVSLLRGCHGWVLFGSPRSRAVQRDQTEIGGGPNEEVTLYCILAAVTLGARAKG